MPADEKSQHWAIRFTFSDKLSIETVTEFCSKNLSIKLACYETAKQPHCHIAYVADKPVCRSTVRAQIAKLGLEGNEQFALTKPKKDQDINGLYRYICKGTETEKPAIFFNRDALIVDNYYGEFWARQKSFKEEVKALAKKRDTEDIKQKSKVIAELSLKHAKREWTVQVADDIVSDVVALYKGNCKEDTLFTASQAIAFAIDPEECKKNAALRMRRKLFPQY